jgi:hypothetical protein
MPLLDEFVKAALLSVLGFFLIEEGKVSGVEFLEEFVPAQRIQAFIPWIEIEPQDARILFASGFGHRRWPPAACLRPLADGVMVLGGHGL